MKDLYQVLGLKKGASQDDIKSAYRKLAKKYHPDANQGDKAIEKKFKEISAAYSILGDAEKRKQYDTGQIDSEGVKRAEQEFYRAYSDDSGFRSSFSNFANFNPEDIFAEFFGRSGSRTHRKASSTRNLKKKGADVSYKLKVSFIEAANGAKRRVSLSDGKVLDVAIPKGAKDGQTLRLKEQGKPGINGGPRGDAFIEIQVQPHPFFSRTGNDIYLEVPVSLDEAILGGSITVPTLNGKVSVKVPEWANAGTKLRLKGKGIQGSPAGDQYVILKIVLPEKTEKDLFSFIQKWTRKNKYDPRKTAGLI